MIIHPSHTHPNHQPTIPPTHPSHNLLKPNQTKPIQLYPSFEVGRPHEVSTILATYGVVSIAIIAVHHPIRMLRFFKRFLCIFRNKALLIRIAMRNFSELGKFSIHFYSLLIDAVFCGRLLKLGSVISEGKHINAVVQIINHGLPSRFFILSSQLSSH